MKRLPILLSLLALVALSASVAYWVLQLYQPAQRPLAAAPAPSMPPPGIDAAATLFGGQASAAVASNYQLTGVIAAGRESVAIIVADNGTPKALKLGKEVSAGVSVQEVHPRYVMLSDGGVLKRIELPTEAKPSSGPAAPQPGQAQAQAQPGQAQPQQFQQPQPQPAQPQPQPQPQPQVQQPAPSTMQGGPPPPASAPPPPPVQTAPPTRSFNSNGLPTPNQ
jgi:general secretion pathway protein C